MPATITVRMSPELIDRVKYLARLQRRSMSGQIIHELERATADLPAAEHVPKAQRLSPAEAIDRLLGNRRKR